MDNEESVNPQLGISRRDLMRRGAVIGGTLVWAAPAVQTVSRAALAQTTGTPEPEDPPGDCHAISYLAVVIQNGVTYQFKINADGGIETDLNAEVPHCTDPDGWGDPTNVGGMPAGTTVDISGECCWVINLPPDDPNNPDDNYTLIGVAMGAGGDGPSPNGYCVEQPEISGDGRTYTFCAPVK